MKDVTADDKKKQDKQQQANNRKKRGEEKVEKEDKLSGLTDCMPGWFQYAGLHTLHT